MAMQQLQGRVEAIRSRRAAHFKLRLWSDEDVDLLLEALDAGERRLVDCQRRISLLDSRLAKLETVSPIQSS